jgi:hypothetical protein
LPPAPWCVKTLTSLISVILVALFHFIEGAMAIERASPIFAALAFTFLIHRARLKSDISISI